MPSGGMPPSLQPPELAYGSMIVGQAALVRLLPTATDPKTAGAPPRGRGSCAGMGLGQPDEPMVSERNFSSA